VSHQARGRAHLHDGVVRGSRLSSSPLLRWWRTVCTAPSPIMPWARRGPPLTLLRYAPRASPAGPGPSRPLAALAAIDGPAHPTPTAPCAASAKWLTLFLLSALGASARSVTVVIRACVCVLGCSCCALSLAKKQKTKENSSHTNPLGRYSRFEEEETVETGCKARSATVVSMEWKVE